MEANCVERHAPSTVSLFPLHPSCSVTWQQPDQWRLAMFMCNLLADLAPLLLFKEVIYYSIHVYAAHSVVEHRPVFTLVLEQNVS